MSRDRRISDVAISVERPDSGGCFGILPSEDYELDGAMDG